jgi:hypothetical protein
MHEDPTLVIYALDSHAAQELITSVQTIVGQQSCGGVGPSRGLIFALDLSTENAFPQISECGSQGVREARGFPDLRPYCLSNKPYFPESFTLDLNCLQRAGVLAGFAPPPAWSCALTTDILFRESVATRLGKLALGVLSIPDEVPPEALLLSAPAVPLMLLAQGMLALKYASIDFELMRLQREEVVTLACSLPSAKTPSEHRERAAVIEAAVDARWQAIWKRRPRD